MSITDIFIFAVKNLMRRKIRTFLTCIGIIIGVISIIVMMSIGIGLEKSTNLQLTQISNMYEITVTKFQEIGSKTNEDKENKKLDNEAVRLFQNIAGVESVLPIKRTDVKISAGKYYTILNIEGVETENIDKFDYEIEQGRLIQPGEKYSIVCGADVAKAFFKDNEEIDYRKIFSKDRQPVLDIFDAHLFVLIGDKMGNENNDKDESGSNFESKRYQVRTVGVLKTSSNRINNVKAVGSIEFVDQIIEDSMRIRKMPEYLINKEKKQYSEIKVRVTKDFDLGVVQEEINKMGYNTTSLRDYQKQLQGVLNIIQAIFFGIGIIALLVAAIGITNTMYMATYERTREIGIIKVLGCDLKDVKKMFLVEAGVVGLLGGTIGLIISYLISFILNIILTPLMYADVPKTEQTAGYVASSIPIWLSVAAILFSFLIGVVSGMLPAKRAMKLKAIEALRNE